MVLRNACNFAGRPSLCSVRSSRCSRSSNGSGATCSACVDSRGEFPEPFGDVTSELAVAASAPPTMRALICVLLLAAICGLCIAEGSEEGTSNYMKAAQALAKGDKLTALSLLTATLKQQPNLIGVRTRAPFWLVSLHLRLVDPTLSLLSHHLSAS